MFLTGGFTKNYFTIFFFLVFKVFFHQMIALNKMRKMLFITSKKLFSILGYSIFCISFPFFSSCQPLPRRWSKISQSLWRHRLGKQEFKNTLFDILRRKKGLILKLGQLIEDKIRKSFKKKYAENVHQKVVPDPLFILINSPKQPMHVRNSCDIKIFWKRTIKKP